MANIIEKTLQDYRRPYVTDMELDFLMGGTPNSRYSKVKRMLAQGKLLHIRRGLYGITKELGYGRKPHSLELAQYIYGPSCISLESALSYHHLIPEAVYTTTSVSGKRRKEFKTPLGIFTYEPVPLSMMYTEVELIEVDGYQFFMAKPWRALCDYVFCYKKDWTSLEPLLNSLRIERGSLPDLRNETALMLQEYYQHTRIDRFLKGVIKEQQRESVL